MRCVGCGNDYATRIVVKWVRNEGKTEKVEYCDRCGHTGSVISPDVYFRKPYFDEHLADEKHPHGQYVESKRHKAEILKKLNLREAGDNINPILGRPAPFIRDEKARQKFFRDNFGG